MTTRNNTNAGAAAHSASSNQVEDRLRARHIDFTFEPNLRLDGILDAEGHQVRLIEHRAPAEMVTRFAQQMKAGAVFPAIVINDQGELIDGNTRRLGAIKAGKEVIAAYICTGLSALEARSLSVELNQCHGLSMTEEEIHSFVLGAVNEGQMLDTKSFARITGVRTSTLSRWMAQAGFQLRAARCGVSGAVVDVLSQSAQALLNAVRLTPVFVQLTALAAEARVSTSELRAIVARVNAAPSEADAMAVVSEERDLRRGDIRAVATGFLSGRSKGRRSAMHVVALLNLDVEDLLDVVPDKQEETIERLRNLRDHIDRAVVRADARMSATEALLSHQPAGRLGALQPCAQGTGRG
jgi:hypothetical protein